MESRDSQAPHVSTDRKPRLHVATAVFASLVFLGFAVLNLAGREDLSPETSARGEFGPKLSQFTPRVEHGWPLTFARREGQSLYGVALWERGRWDVDHNLSWFSQRAIAINAALCVLLAAALAIPFDFWRRRRCSVLQIHIRELLLLMTAAGFFLGLRTAEQRATDSDGRALAAIDRAQGRPPYHAASIAARAQWEQPEPSWWGLITGQRPERVVGIEVRDEPLASLVPLKKLKTLHHHRRLSLEELELLARWPELEALNLAFVSGPRSAQPHVIELPKLPRLRALNLFGADFRGDGLEHLVSLEVLDVSQTLVDDAALVKIAKLPRLRDLALDHTNITSEGLAQLASMKQLETLSLRACDVKEQAVAALQAELPDCDIQTAPRKPRPRFAPAPIVVPGPVPGQPLPAAVGNPPAVPFDADGEWQKQLEAIIRQQREVDCPSPPPDVLQ